MQFGEVFRFREKLYVFLAPTEETIYAAEILDHAKSEILKQAYERAHSTGNRGLQKSIAFCFVELQTTEYAGQLAHFKDTDRSEMNGEGPDILNKRLSLDDLKQIKEEILGGGFAPIRLQKLIEDISL